MMEPVQVWRSKYKDIGLTPDPISGGLKFANYLGERTNNKLEIKSSTATINPSSVFSWNAATFAAIIALPASPDPVTPRTIMANAWQSAVLSSVMSVNPGSAVSPPVGNGIFGVPGVCVPDPATLLLAFSGLLADLLGSPPSGDAEASKIPDAFRKAFASVTYTVSGADTTAPTPVPIVIPLSKVM